MKVSLITVCFNAEEVIKKTLESVKLSKTHQLEFILVDGASTDGTLAQVDKYRDIIDIFISEPDKGIYDAINKGIKCAKGDLIGLLHAGSILKERGIEEVLKVFRNSKNSPIIAGSAIFGNHDPVLTFLRSKIKPLSSKNTQILHETLFIPRKYFDIFGSYNLSFPISADYSWVSNALKSGVPVEYTDFILVDYCKGWGASADKNLFLKKIDDHFRVMKRDVNLFFAIKRYLFRFIGFYLKLLLKPIMFKLKLKRYNR